MAAGKGFEPLTFSLVPEAVGAVGTLGTLYPLSYPAGSGVAMFRHNRNGDWHVHGETK